MVGLTQEQIDKYETILRAGLYERVSHDDQAKYGYSIKTQIDILNEYCEKNKIKIVDHYTDEGVSGGNAPEKRPELARLLEDVKAGKIDIILFTKLDRWTRSPKYYYRVQDVLDEYKVSWKAVLEDYETVTSDGSFKVNLMLALAEQERKRTSERIKTVFNNRAKNKEAFLSSTAVSFGYKKEKDENGIYRLVKDEAVQDAVQDFWDMTIKYENISKSAKYANETYNLKRTRTSWNELSANPLYTGTYRGVENFCEPYVSKEDFDRIQSRRIKASPKKRIYLFTGLMKCPSCNNKMTANYYTSTLASGEKREHYSYRCPNKRLNICDNKHCIAQNTIENWLLDNIETLIKYEMAKVEIEKAKPKRKPKVNISALKEKLRRLEFVYMAGNKTDEEYLAETKAIKEQIAKAEAEQHNPELAKDFTQLKALLETDFKSIYETLDAEDKRRLWRSIIKEIKIKGNKVVSVDFLYHP